MTDLSASSSSTLAVIAGDRVLGTGHSHATKLNTFLLLAAVVFLNAAGNLSLAFGMRHISENLALNPLDYIRAMLNPFVAGGTVLLIFWLLSRMTLLSWADLSFVLPCTGLGYILAAVLGNVFLHEAVTPTHWIGTVLIFAGTIMVGSTDQQTRVEHRLLLNGVAQ